MSEPQRPVGFLAAVFDLDGVVTFTARVHASAWKELFDAYLCTRAERHGEPFRAFTDADYLAHVDGRPRHDGVRTFLASRGIELPEGAPSDPPEAETVAGLGSRKDLLFRARVKEMGVDVDEEAVRFVRALRARGIRVGMASSSKNTDMVLETAGLEDLFEARVDGNVSDRLGLRGKPAPDIFLRCLEMLGAPDPARAMVVEDAEAGVEAGRAGGFGLVLGVDRGGRAIALREHGANWIIRDFREVSPGRIEDYFENRPYARPNALAHWSDLVAGFHGRRPAVFLDHDGTLTQVASRAGLAALPEEVREALRQLAGAAGSIDRDDGRVVRCLREALGLDLREVVPLYIGDAPADEDAFRAFERYGIGILVTGIPRPTSARYSLQDVEEVRELLRRLGELERRNPNDGRES